MERKIGEIFEYNGEWYQCMKSPDGSCKHCDMNFGGKCPIPIKECVASARSDLSYIIFKKLEKVGEPIEFTRGLYFQRYQLANSTAFYEGDTHLFFNAPTKTFVYIEIKNKEDMEEKKLRAFNLEEAKQGKPVCTRDGRKARIICFDRRLFYKNVSYPILAVVERSDGEDDVCGYNEKGKVLIEDGAEYKDDLMMLPEKKEGWVNVYKDSVYDTKDEALNRISEYRGYIDTIKISWEE